MSIVWGLMNYMRYQYANYFEDRSVSKELHSDNIMFACSTLLITIVEH